MRLAYVQEQSAADVQNERTVIPHAGAHVVRPADEFERRPVRNRAGREERKLRPRLQHLEIKRRDI